MKIVGAVGLVVLGMFCSVVLTVLLAMVGDIMGGF